jgi:hypothetical protein
VDAAASGLSPGAPARAPAPARARARNPTPVPARIPPGFVELPAIPHGLGVSHRGNTGWSPSEVNGVSAINRLPACG